MLFVLVLILFSLISWFLIVYNGLIQVKENIKKSWANIDVHMMVVNPENLVEPFARAGADNITFHIEATDNPDEVIDLIRATGKMVGISLKPSTPFDSIKPYMDKIDLILVMIVEPGFGGQGYIKSSTARIMEIKKYLKDNCLERVQIQVDGGIKLHNANEVISAGGDILVAGSEVFGSENPQKVIKDFYANAKSVVSI